MSVGELLIKIGPGAGYEDGDVLCAFNSRARRCVHAQHQCNIENSGYTNDGTRPPQCLTRWFLELTKQYRFDRVSGTEVERTDLVTNEKTLFGPSEIDVPEFIRRRMKQNRHAIFGQAGQEFWYGGRTYTDNTRLDQVWAKIAELSGRTEDEEEFQLWPMGRLDIRHHLAVRTVDFTDEEAADLVRPRLERDDDGNPVLDEDGQPKVISKRLLRIQWSDLLDDIQVTASAVMDKSVEVGKRIIVPKGKLAFRSKDQPQQHDRSRLLDKEFGVPITQRGEVS